MSTSALLLIALASVVLLLLLVIKAKAHPFVALLIVSLLVAFATGIPADKIITTIEKGMGGLLGHIASIIILGSMLGVLIEMSGGAESLAKTLTGVLGAKRTIAALTIVAFILGTPVFFEVGFIIIIPLIYGFSKVAHVSPLKFGLPMAGVMLTVHVALPTHPGAAAAAGILHSDVGWLMLAGIGVSVVVGIVGYFVARFINRRHYHLSINVLEQQQTAEVPDLSVNAQQTRLPPPNALVIGGLIVVPIMLIVSGTLCQALLLPENAVRQLMTVIGTPPVALLISLGLASWTLGIRRRMSLKKLGEVTGSAIPSSADVIPSSADVILVAGAGGAFGGVLVASGIGNALAEALETIHLPLMPAAFLLSLVLRASQGSATVAILTTSGLLSQAVVGLEPLQLVLVTLATCFGSLGLSHVNDAGFWVVTRYLGLSVPDGLKTWTVLTTIMGVTGFLITWLLWFAL
ncbi:GntP family transporter [Klebsiella pneumoniae]|nr:GntP family transporter [Klebsiella pneumoniae]EKW0026522.1 GntP family transporter [Klebsiella pneumoniae]EKW0029659.1 GntP family transporter [Klebsiella pneumoniae]MCE0096047.1 GntP family transporter [Klebsiella pneumoniae]QSC22239.1 GntP family transporter [Klebsiella pneumoniae]ROG71077.1 GntP family transporter [Klebsiella pneumoniae subsp. pneumoniae]